jgi:hypothetical protein
MRRLKPASGLCKPVKAEEKEYHIYIRILNPGLPWQKLHLTRRRIFLPANWT